MAATIDPASVQGDLVHGLPKLCETFIFFKINDDIPAFQQHLKELLKLITTAEQVVIERQKNKQHKHSGHGIRQSVGVNIGFSTWGTQKLKLTDINDALFEAGMLKDAAELGEQNEPKNPGQPRWIPQFKQHIDGIILVAGDSKPTLRNEIDKISKIFHVGHSHATMQVLHTIDGAVRPGDQSRNEHFGFADAISQPAVKGVGMDLLPKQETIPQGILFLGRDGDEIKRPEWALNGSFLVFRQLPQLVPEFDKFCERNALDEDELVPGVKGSELLGARMVGRWKSGAPLDITDKVDNEPLGKDPNRNNFFEHFDDSQARCPWAAHTRKMYPREGSGIPEDVLNQHRILRRGIPYGDEVSSDEHKTGNTTKDRGLLFVCYQSNLSNGFHFLQKSWANNVGFPPNKQPLPGVDPIIGQNSNDEVRSMSGSDPLHPDKPLTLNTAEFVGSHGGEYFFYPSMVSLRQFFASQGKHDEV